jgi:hypothetical protein
VGVVVVVVVLVVVVGVVVAVLDVGVVVVVVWWHWRDARSETVAAPWLRSARSVELIVSGRLLTAFEKD